MLKERLSGMLSVQKSLQIEFSEVCKRYSRGKQLDEVIFALPAKKLEKIGVRGYFVRKVYDYIQAQAKLEGISLRSDLPSKWFDVSLPFLAEMIISLQYYHNQILDRKGGVTSPVAINRNLIAGNLLRSFINWYIRDTFKEDLETMHTVQDTVEKIMTYVDVGQFMEKNWGTYECFVNGVPEDTWLGEEIEEFIDVSVIDWIWEEIHKSGVPVEYERFVRHYLKRIYLTNASLFILMVKLMIDLLEHKKDTGLLYFTSYSAISLQLMNDNIDFAKPATVAKCEFDDCCDLRNKTITLPILYSFFIQKKSPILMSFNNESPDFNEILLEATEYIFNYAKPTSENIAKNASFYLNRANLESTKIIDLLDVVYSNKYYDYLMTNHNVFTK